LKLKHTLLVVVVSLILHILEIFAVLLVFAVLVCAHDTHLGKLVEHLVGVELRIGIVDQHVNKVRQRYIYSTKKQRHVDND